MVVVVEASQLPRAERSVMRGQYDRSRCSSAGRLPRGDTSRAPALLLRSTTRRRGSCTNDDDDDDDDNEEAEIDEEEDKNEATDGSAAEEEEDKEEGGCASGERSVMAQLRRSNTSREAAASEPLPSPQSSPSLTLLVASLPSSSVCLPFAWPRTAVAAAAAAAAPPPPPPPPSNPPPPPRLKRGARSSTRVSLRASTRRGPCCTNTARAPTHRTEEPLRSSSCSTMPPTDRTPPPFNNPPEPDLFLLLLLPLLLPLRSTASFCCSRCPSFSIAPAAVTAVAVMAVEARLKVATTPLALDTFRQPTSRSTRRFDPDPWHTDPFDLMLLLLSLLPLPSFRRRRRRRRLRLRLRRRWRRRGLFWSAS